MTPSIDRTLHQFLTITDLGLITEFDFLPNCTRFPWNICNGCGMPTEDAYSSGHLVLSHFGTCVCSDVETNLSWARLVSGLMNFEHPSVLLFCFELTTESGRLFHMFTTRWVKLCCLIFNLQCCLFIFKLLPLVRCMALMSNNGRSVLSMLLSIL